MSKWRNSTFLLSVRRSPSKVQSTVLPRGALHFPGWLRALGMLVFLAASADLDVKVVAVNDPFRALDYMVYQLNTTESTGGSTHHRESGFLDVLYRQQKSRSFLACCRESCPHAHYYNRMRGEICSLYFLCRCEVACLGWMLLVLSRRLNDQMSNELVV